MSGIKFQDCLVLQVLEKLKAPKDAKAIAKLVAKTYDLDENLIQANVFKTLELGVRNGIWRKCGGKYYYDKQADKIIMKRLDKEEKKMEKMATSPKPRAARAKMDRGGGKQLARKPKVKPKCEIIKESDVECNERLRKFERKQHGKYERDLESNEVKNKYKYDFELAWRPVNGTKWQRMRQFKVSEDDERPLEMEGERMKAYKRNADEQFDSYMETASNKRKPERKRKNICELKYVPKCNRKYERLTKGHRYESDSENAPRVNLRKYKTETDTDTEPEYERKMVPVYDGQYEERFECKRQGASELKRQRKYASGRNAGAF